jgi:hypothetical protein
MAVRLIGLPDGANHSLKMTILTPSMEPASEPMEMGFPFHAPPNATEGWEVAILMPLAVVFLATEEGAYTITIEVDGNGTSSKSIPMRMTTGPLPQ